MSKTSLTIIKSQPDMTPDKVMQELAKLYNVSEARFEGLCKSLFVMKQPYVLFKKIDEAIAEEHLLKLTDIGLECRVDDEFSGLSLVPVSNAKSEKVTCPACNQLAGDEEMCQSCGVIIHKYLKQKEFDEQFQRSSKAVSSSEEKMKKLYEERSEKREKSKKTNITTDTKTENNKKENIHQPHDSHDDFSVKSNEKTSRLVYAAMASVCLVVAGTGIVVHEIFNNNQSSDELLVSSDASITSTSFTEPGNPETIASIDQSEQPNPAEQTVFDKRLQSKRELEALRQQVRKLHEQKMLFTADGVIASSENPVHRLIGGQELIKLDGINGNTGNKLQAIYTIANSLHDDIDRIDALTHLSSTYLHFDLYADAARIHSEATKIAQDVTDNAEERILAEVMLAEHQLYSSETNTSPKRYKIAKDKAVEISQPNLADAAFSYIALSEVTQGLTTEANVTIAMIADVGTREGLRTQINKLYQRSQAAVIPDQAAAHGQVKTGDSQIDDLIEMTTKNKKTMNTASQLLKSLDLPDD